MNQEERKKMYDEIESVDNKIAEFISDKIKEAAEKHVDNEGYICSKDILKYFLDLLFQQIPRIIEQETSMFYYFHFKYSHTLVGSSFSASLCNNILLRQTLRSARDKTQNILINLVRENTMTNKNIPIRVLDKFNQVGELEVLSLITSMNNSVYKKPMSNNEFLLINACRGKCINLVKLLLAEMKINGEKYSNLALEEVAISCCPMLLQIFLDDGLKMSNYFGGGYGGWEARTSVGEIMMPLALEAAENHNYKYSVSNPFENEGANGVINLLMEYGAELVSDHFKKFEGLGNAVARGKIKVPKIEIVPIENVPMNIKNETE